jgi:hypothetical protein
MQMVGELSQIEQAPFRLALTLLAFFCYGVLIVIAMHQMIMKQLDFLPGMLVCISLLVLAVLVITLPNEVMSAFIMIASIGAAITVPFALSRMDDQIIDEIDLSVLERAHLNLSMKPENAPAWFELARALHAQGLPGHAIVIGDLTMASLSDNKDPLKFTSMRDHFRAEGAMVTKWKRELTDPDAFDPMPCPMCGHLNEAGTIRCGQCDGPYLLELARQKFGSKGIIGRLAFMWFGTTIVVLTAGFVSLVLSPGLTVLVIFAALVAMGFIANKAFRTNTLRGPRSSQF